MAVFDVKALDAVEEEARKEINDERVGKAKAALKNQIRIVASAELVLANERRKLEDLKAQILEGNL